MVPRRQTKAKVFASPSLATVRSDLRMQAWRMGMRDIFSQSACCAVPQEKVQGRCSWVNLKLRLKVFRKLRPERWKDSGPCFVA